MVTIKFFGLIRSNHNIKSVTVKPQSLQAALDDILKENPKLSQKELYDAVLFINNKKVMHLNRFDTKLNDGDEVIFTNFVGGG